MNAVFFVLLFIPLAYSGPAPECKELGKILESYEKDLQKKFITDCGKISHSDLVRGTPAASSDFLEGKVCSDLATIETQLETLKLQESVLTGINKLKVTIKEAKEKVSANNLDARVAGMTFVDSLDTAQSLEVLLQTVGEDGKPFMQRLKEIPENKRINQLDLSNRVAELCKGMPKVESNACNPNVFKPGPEAARELLNMLKNSDPSPDRIASWQKMLAIKRKKPQEGETETYSFNEMKNELSGAFAQLDTKDILTKDHLRAIQKLDDFENAPGLSFVEDLSVIKDKKKAKVASDKFSFLIGDAKLRQQYEIQSKMSIMWQEVKKVVPNLSEGQRGSCENSKSLFSEAVACLTNLESVHSKMTGDAKANLSRFLPALRTSVDYANHLEKNESVCKEEIHSQDEVTEACYADFNKELGDVQDQIFQLNILKDRIASENMDNMKFRNFALMKWGDQKCQTLSTTIDFCDETTAISKDMAMTFSDVMKVAIVFAPTPEAQEAVGELCEKDELKKNEERLCSFLEPDPVDNITKPQKANDDVDGPLLAPDGGNEKAQLRDAWIQGGANALREALGFMLPRTAPPGYPYPYNYSPWNNGNPPLGIADSILFNARTYGAYGFYTPTPGYTPFHAFGPTSTMISPYTPVSASGGKYFGF